MLPTHFNPESQRVDSSAAANRVLKHRFGFTKTKQPFCANRIFDMFASLTNSIF
jgi:hypothetical protein